MWPSYKDTQLAFVLEDATAALKKAQKARAPSETKDALGKLAAVAIIFVLLMLHFGRFDRTAMIMLSLPFGLIGGLWAVYLAGYNMSVAVAVGFIALGGIAVETAVVMLLYMDQQVLVPELRPGDECGGFPVPVRKPHAQPFAPPGPALNKGSSSSAQTASVSASRAEPPSASTLSPRWRIWRRAR